MPAPSVDYAGLYRMHGADGFAMLDRMGAAVALLDAAHMLIRTDEDRLWRVRENLTVDSSALSLGEEPAAWSVHTDEQGFRDHSDQGDWLALGDSCTFGWGVDTDFTLEIEARSEHRVRNRGVPGYSVLQGERVAEPSRVLLLNFGANDGHMVLQGDAERLNARQTRVGRLRFGLAQLHLVRHARNLLYRPWAKGTVLAWQAGAYRPRVGPEAFEGALLRLSEGAEQTVLLQICARDEYGDAMARVAATSPSIHHLLYDGDTVDGCHPTAQGHAQLAADVLALGL